MLEKLGDNKVYMVPFGSKTLIGRLKVDKVEGTFTLKSVADVITMDIPVQGKNAQGQIVESIQVVYYMIPLGNLPLSTSMDLCEVTSDSPVYGSYYQNILKLDIKMAVPSDIPSSPLRRP